MVPRNPGVGRGVPAETGRPYFLVVGFLALGEGWQHDDWVGLAELVLGLLPVIAGLGVPFHGSMACS